MKLGRRRPRIPAPKLQLRSYFKSAILPTPPKSTNYWPAAQASLSQSYLNDDLGDCVIAGMQHIAGVVTANAGSPPALFDDVNTKRLYHDIGGYVDGDESTDNGCDEQTALNYWKANGLTTGGDFKIDSWAAVESMDINEIKTSIWLFENCVFGVELPDRWIRPEPQNGFVWDLAGGPNSDNGHCFVGVDYNDQGVVICSWGLKGLITWQAVQYYCRRQFFGELYTVLSADAISKTSQKSPAGFDVATLRSDLQALGQ